MSFIASFMSKNKVSQSFDLKKSFDVFRHFYILKFRFLYPKVIIKRFFSNIGSFKRSDMVQIRLYFKGGIRVRFSFSDKGRIRIPLR